jgi:hypothetical protein
MQTDAAGAAGAATIVLKTVNLFPQSLGIFVKHSVFALKQRRVLQTRPSIHKRA